MVIIFSNKKAASIKQKYKLLGCIVICQVKQLRTSYSSSLSFRTNSHNQYQAVIIILNIKTTSIKKVYMSLDCVVIFTDDVNDADDVGILMMLTMMLMMMILMMSMKDASSVDSVDGTGGFDSDGCQC